MFLCTFFYVSLREVGFYCLETTKNDITWWKDFKNMNKINTPQFLFEGRKNAAGLAKLACQTGSPKSWLRVKCWKYFFFKFQDSRNQKYSSLRCLLHVKLRFGFYLGWSGSILWFRQNIIEVGSKSWLHTSSSNITLSLPSYAGSALLRELTFCNGNLSLLYFW